jgi:putative acetyltransferase
MNPAHPMRPFLPADTVALQDLYAQSIEALTQDDYDEDQRLAWISLAADPEAFAKRMLAGVTLLVERDGEIMGFASLKDGTIVDMLYVHPYSVAEGVATTLLEAVERLAKARGATKLTADVSDTAHDFFLSRGYVPVQRNNLVVDEVWLSNTTMAKSLAEATSSPAKTADEAATEVEEK